MTVITISRQAGSLGDEIAARLAEKIGIELIDRERIFSGFLAPVATDDELRRLANSPRYFLSESSSRGISFRDYLEGALREYARRQPFVMLGMAGRFFFAQEEEALHLRITAGPSGREARFRSRKSPQELALLGSRERGEPPAKARRASLEAGPREQLDRLYRRFSQVLFAGDETETLAYHAVLNTDFCSAESCILLAKTLYDEELTLLRLRGGDHRDGQDSLRNGAAFALKNRSEIEFAHLLDIYHIEWRYEPRTFPVEWDTEGRVTLAFSPDFYLPRFDLFLELTEMKQQYVTLKNKKLRKLKELYPQVNCRIVYKRDLQSLFERFDAEADDMDMERISDLS